MRKILALFPDRKTRVQFARDAIRRLAAALGIPEEEAARRIDHALAETVDADAGLVRRAQALQAEVEQLHLRVVALERGALAGAAAATAVDEWVEMISTEAARRRGEET